MKPRHFAFILFISILPLLTSAQAGMWTWMKGSVTMSPPPVYGTQGVEDPNNTPPGLYEPAEWTDTAGNFWLFGGLGFDSLGTQGAFSDLWKYNSVTNNWTWVKGPRILNDLGTNGVVGVPALSNNPSARGWGTATWTDLNGDLWLLSGINPSLSGNVFPINDFWRYNIASNTWTLMTSGGPSYGTQGIPSFNNKPGGRNETSATWVDAQNNLWVFGGMIATSSLNDLWKYNVSTNIWTWMKGSNIWNQPGVYGTRGVADSLNTPCARACYSTWTDGAGNLWLFGGMDRSHNEYNDMWRYEPATNNWTWMSGTNLINHPGSYGTVCTSWQNYVPASRFENRARWKDACGNFWLYGGVKSGSGHDFAAAYSDLWCFNPTTLVWSIANGNPTNFVPPVFGIPGIAGAANTPGGRGGSVSWTSKTGELFFFGGNLNVNWPDVYNDVWKFVIDTTCTGMSQGEAIDLGPDTTYCGNIIRNLHSGNSNTLWSTTTTGTQITVTSPGTYWAKITNRCGTVTDTITISQQPPVIINLGNDTALCIGQLFVLDASYSNSTYRWHDNSTNPTFNVMNTGTYSVTVTTMDGCTATDSIIVNNPITLSVVSVNTSCGNNNGSVIANIITGAFPYSYSWNTGDTSASISDLPAGAYIVAVTDVGGCIAIDTVIVTASSVNPVIINANKSIMCSGDTAQICAPSGHANYLWNNAATATCITTSQAGNYYVTVTDNNGCTAESNHLAINVYPLPPVSISVNGDTLSVYNAVTQQWYLNGSAINGATNNIYIATQGGSYTVMVTDSNGCAATSSPVLVSGIDNITEDDVVSVFPNPTQNNWQLTVGNNLLGGIAEVFDANGRLIWKSEIRNQKSEVAPNISRGVYLLRISSSKSSVTRKLIRL